MSSSDSEIDTILWEDSEDDYDEDFLTFYRNAEAAAVVCSLNSESKKRGGSVPGKRPNINRYFQEADEKLFRDYFAEDSIYDAEMFRRRFRMNKSLFINLIADVERKNPYFQQKIDAVGKIGLSARQKCTAAMRILAYGSCADSVDELVRIGESTALNTLKEFCKTIDELYGATYLRSPNARDVQKLLAENESRGFPGMLGSLDCTHWQWKNCPTAWTGQFKGKEKKPTVILEAVASKNLHIWHAFFGMPGACNDINVLDRSTLFQELYNGTAPSASYEVNGQRYNQCYYLADGIYPHLATLVQTISAPVGKKKQLFAEYQEAVRKDVERAFGVLKGRFAIIAQPARHWYMNELKLIMRCCIILHNFIIDSKTEENDLDDYLGAEIPVDDNIVELNNVDYNTFLQRYASVHDTSKHYKLQNDLIEHIWALYGKSKK